MSETDVSVIITTKNYGRFLREAIESVLNQSIGMKRIELIVIDDGSVDETANVVSRYSGVIHYIYQETVGQAGALNTGFKSAGGEFIALLDADDYFYKTKLEETIAKFKEDSRIGMVHHRLDVINNSGQITHTTPFRARLAEGRLREQLIKYGGSCYAFVTVGTTGLAFRRRNLEPILPIPEIFRLSAETYLITQVSLDAYVGAIHKSLGVFRRHGRSFWSTQELTVEVIQNRLLAPILNISKLVGQRLNRRAEPLDLRDDFNYVEYCCLLDKLNGSHVNALRNYILFIRAISKDLRIKFSYKLWRLASVLFMLLVPYRIYWIAKECYAKNNLFYKIRTKVLPNAK